MGDIRMRRFAAPAHRQQQGLLRLASYGFAIAIEAILVLTIIRGAALWLSI